MSLTKHKYLITYRLSEMIYDLTNLFCERFLAKDFGKIPTRRTIDQMVQAARSGKQNIIEGVGQSRTSKKGEIKLLGVANASLEELIADYEDFLRVRKFSHWEKSDPRIMNFRSIFSHLSHLNNLSDLGELKQKPGLPQSPEYAANYMLTLCHITTYLLSKQIAKAEYEFVHGGGYTENLFRKRITRRMQQ